MSAGQTFGHWAVKFHQAGYCGADDGCGPRSAYHSTNVATASSGHPPKIASKIEISKHTNNQKIKRVVSLNEKCFFLMLGIRTKRKQNIKNNIGN